MNIKLTWWQKIYYPVCRFWHKYKPSSIWFEIKMFHQRGKRGWSDRDWWSMDEYLEIVIPAMLRKHAKDGFGYPGGRYSSQKEWSKALLRAADDIEAYYIFKLKKFPKTKPARVKYFKDSIIAEKRTKKGMLFVANNFTSLWD